MASTASNSVTLSSKHHSILVSNDLMKLLKDPHTEDRGEEKVPSLPLASLTPLTMDELLMDVKDYIMKNKLYDPQNPVKILVHENKLGSLLGKSEFLLNDVRDLLLEKFIYPVAETNSSEVICSINDKMSIAKKRKLDSNASEISPKLSKNVLDKERDNSCDSDESVYSFQNYETESVKDSDGGDNFSVDGLIIAETYDVEYEIESPSGEDEYSCESDSDIEEFVKKAVINFIAQSIDSDIEYLADESSGDEDSEKELSDEDKWRCIACFTINDPIMRQCAACWTERVGWLSETCAGNRKSSSQSSEESKQKAFARSKRKKKSNKHKNLSNQSQSDASNLSQSDSSGQSQSSAVGKLSELTQCAAAESGSLLGLSMGDDDSLGVTQSASNSQESDKSQVETKQDKQLCLFCCERPADSTIIHGRVGCKVSCFPCGNKLMAGAAGNKRCPVCRRTIEKIVYLYNS